MKLTAPRLAGLQLLVIALCFSFSAVAQFDSTTASNAVTVKYGSFTGSLSGKNILLNWVTSDEGNTSHFEIERSFDCSNFTQVGIALDGFEDGSQKTYAFKDNSALTNTQAVAYYRLKQIKANGNFTYSNVVAVAINKTNNNIQINIPGSSQTDTHIALQGMTAQQSTK